MRQEMSNYRRAGLFMIVLAATAFAGILSGSSPATAIAFAGPATQSTTKPMRGVAATAATRRPAAASVSAADALVSFLSPLGKDASTGTNAAWLLPFLSVEVCELDGSSCSAAVARLTAEGSRSERLRLEADEGIPHFHVVWHAEDAGLLAGTGYRVRVLVGPMEVGHRDLLVSSKGDPKAGGDPFLINAKRSLPIKFRIDEQAFVGGLANLAAVPSTVPAGGVVGLVANPSVSASGELQLLIAGQPAPVRARSEGDLIAGAPLFLDASRWPAPPRAAVDLLLFRDGAAVALGRRVLTITPLQDAPGSAGQARQALDGTVAAFGRIGEALASEPGAQEQWLTALSAALDELVNGADPRSLAGALAAADAAELRLLDAWFAASGMLTALQQYEGMVAEAAGLAQADAVAGLTALRMLSLAGPAPVFRALTAAAPATTSFPTDTKLSEAMKFYETVKAFGEEFVAETNAEFNLYVGIAAGAIGLVKSVPAVAIITAVITLADFAVNKLFIGLLPANIDRFELTLASVLLDPGEKTDAVLHIHAVNDPPPIGIQDVIGTLLSVMGVKDAPTIQSLTDALLQTANYMLGLVQAGISAYANEHPDLQLNATIGSVPAMRWQATVTNPALVERNTNTRSIIRGIADEVNWRAETGAASHGQGEIFATTVANAFGDDVLNSNTVIVTVENVDVTVSPASVSLAPGGSQQFTAAVTHATDTAVAWTAAGGAIDPNGFYIAGNTPGTYTVTATSVEQPRSATATVVISAPAIAGTYLGTGCDLDPQDNPPLCRPRSSGIGVIVTPMEDGQLQLEYGIVVPGLGSFTILPLDIFVVSVAGESFSGIAIPWRRCFTLFCVISDTRRPINGRITASSISGRIDRLNVARDGFERFEASR